MKIFGKKEDKGKRFIEDMTEEEIQKYLSGKTADKPGEQTQAARIDESVGEQESVTGTEDSQSAFDRVDESEGEKAADVSEEQTVQAETSEPTVEKDSEQSAETVQPESASPQWGQQILSEIVSLKELLSAKQTPPVLEDNVKSKVGSANLGMEGSGNSGMPDEISMIIERMKNSK